MSKNDVPRFTKVRTADLSAMTDLLTDAFMAFEDIAMDALDALDTITNTKETS